MMFPSSTDKGAQRSPAHDPLLPKLTIYNATDPPDRQQCVLNATEVAKQFVKSKSLPSQHDMRLRRKETAAEEAKRRCIFYTQSPTTKQYMGQLIIIFGKYNGKTFKWLLEHDVGYVRYIVDNHVKEKNKAKDPNSINDCWIKDCLLKYAEFFPQVASHFEKNVDQWLYGQGRFKSFNFKEMWEWYQQHKILRADPQLGTAHERKMAKEAYESVCYRLSLDEKNLLSRNVKTAAQSKTKAPATSTGPQTAAKSTTKTPSTSTTAAKSTTKAPATSTHPQTAAKSTTKTPSTSTTAAKSTTKAPATSTHPQTAAKSTTKTPSTSTTAAKSTTKTPPTSAQAKQFSSPAVDSPSKHEEFDDTWDDPEHNTMLVDLTPQAAQDQELQASAQGTSAAQSTKPESSRVRHELQVSEHQSHAIGKSKDATPDQELQASKSTERTSAVVQPTTPDQPQDSERHSHVIRKSKDPVKTKSSRTSTERSEEPKPSKKRQPARTGQSDESVRSPSTSAKKGKPPKAQQKNQPDDTSKINYEGWHRSWETSPNGLPKADLTWLKEDSDRGLFQPVGTYTDTKGETKRRKVLKDDHMWFHPPEAPGKVGTGPPTADAFFRSRVFFWRPVGVWGYSLKCPRKTCPARNSDKTFLYRCGYSKTVRYICDVADWYCMLTEVLACSACKKAAGEEDSDHHIGRFLSWDTPILSQLTPAHQARFPAVLTMFRGVDKRVVRLLRDRTVGNTMSKIRRQIQENHCEEYLSRKDMYTTLLTSLVKPGSIVSALGHDKFQPPPQRRKLPSDKLLRKTYLINEADNIEDYRTQIMSTFGRVLKFDSTKKICKKLSGVGRGTAEWCTNVGNEFSQVLTSIFTCEESVEKLQPLAQGLVERYSRAGEPSPELLYIDRGCCRANGVSSIESLFEKWVEDGMVVRLDIFHWINRFTAALRTDHHSKYALFKSALSAAVFAYNKEDISVLVKAIRHGFPDKLANLSDGQILASKFVLKDDLRHYVRRVTVGAQETFARVQHAIDVLKGPAGQDENGVTWPETRSQDK